MTNWVKLCKRDLKDLTRSGTSYAVQEHILQQIGLLLLAFGLLLTLMVYRKYLRAPSSDD